MAISVAVRQLAITASGSVSITGLSFQPNLVFVQGCRLSGAPDAELDYTTACFGYAVSSTDRGCISWASRGDGAGNDSSNSINATTCWNLEFRSTGIYMDMDFTSMNSDGATFNVTTYVSNQWVQVTLIGGLDNVAGLQATTPLATGNENKTGFGFNPNLICVLPGWVTSYDTHTNSGSLGGVGWADGTEQFAMAFWGNDFGGHASSIARNDSVFQSYKASFSVDTIGENAAWNAWVSDGVQLNWTVVDDAVAAKYFIVGIKATDAAVRVENAPTSSGTQAFTGAGLTPVGALTFGGQFTSSQTTSQSGARNFFGMTDGTNNRTTWQGYEDTGSATAGTRVTRQETDELFVQRDEGTGAGSSLLAEGNIDSLDSDGLTINFTTADIAYQFAIVYFGAVSDLSVSVFEHVIGRDFT